MTTEPSLSPLQEAEAAFERGNYAEVRRLLGPLRAQLPEGAEREAVEALWARIQPDPRFSYLLFAALLLLVLVTAFAYASGRP